MPIHCPIQIRPLSGEAFAEIDRVVMSCAYVSQNTLGRLCDERVYENDLAARLNMQGISEVRTQVPVTVTHSAFSKRYRLGLVVRQMIYELKTVIAFGPEHDTQTIHYAVLLELGTHRLQCHAEDTAFIVTALTAEHAAYEQHLSRLLKCTRLNGLQWINLNHAEVAFVTLPNGKGMEAN